MWVYHIQFPFYMVISDNTILYRISSLITYLETENHGRVVVCRYQLDNNAFNYSFNSRSCRLSLHTRCKLAISQKQLIDE